MKNIADSLTAKKLGSECVQETEKGGITGTGINPFELHLITI